MCSHVSTTYFTLLDFGYSGSLEAAEELGHAPAGSGGSAVAATTGSTGNDPIVSELDANSPPLILEDMGGFGDWGLVGADGTEDGFAVIANEDSSSSHAGTAGTGKAAFGNSKPPIGPAGGVVPMSSPYPSTSKHPISSTTDVSAGSTTLRQPQLSDHQLVDELMRRGRVSDAGPSYCGARRSPATTIASARVILVTASGSYAGILSLSKKELYFASSAKPTDGAPWGDDAASVGGQDVSEGQQKIRRRRWAVTHMSAVYLRRFRLRDTALEVFFRRGKHKHFFVDFGHSQENARIRQEFARAVMTQAPATAFKQWSMLSQYRLVPEHHVTEKWINREMSNFEYLMALNTISGRSFNDLCQYPVMPWVLTQFTGSTIDLSDPSVYRDLSKPMGALNEHRLRDFLDRYESFAENESVTMDIPPFMYGSHYSTMVGVVLHFLVRLQPFASLHMEMQNGRFDVADRLFSSVARTFAQNTTQLSEVKELTPEWFTTPEMFLNDNHFELGTTQDGTRVHDVELPPWALGSAQRFVQIHMAALESDYVSAHLHEWIDLIFGYKQRGPAAVEACNVFYYLTYAGSVDRSLMADESLRKATELQIAHFGQVPLQLFKSPHPQRALPKVALQQREHLHPRLLSECYNSSQAGNTSPTATTCSNNEVYASLSEVPDSLCLNDDCLLAACSGAAVITRRNKYLQQHAPIGPAGSARSGQGANQNLTPNQSAHINSSLSNISAGNVLACVVGKEQLICVLDSGVLESYRYSTSDAAKTALSGAIAQRNKNEALKIREAQLVALAQQQQAQLAHIQHGSALAIDLMNDDLLPLSLSPPNSPFLDTSTPSPPLPTSPPSISSPPAPSLPSLAVANSQELVFSALSKFVSEHGTIIDVRKYNSFFDVLPRVPLARPFSPTLPSPFVSTSLPPTSPSKTSTLRKGI
jgi:hypothetical protein